MSHAVEVHPRQAGNIEEFWQNVVHWRREWQPTPVFLSGEPHEEYEKENDMIPEDESHRSVGVQYATGKEGRAITNNSRKNEAAGPKQKQR